MPKLNVAVIGIGNMGQNHARVYSELPNASLVAVCDINRQQGEELAKKFSCLFYEDYKKMLVEQKIDAVSIVVPTSLHNLVALEVLEKGIHVLLEKPIAMDLIEAIEIINKAKEKKINLMIGHIERFNPAVRKVKEMIDRGDLGKISAIIARRVGGFPPQIKDANIAIDLAIHDIDITNYLLNALPIEINVNKQKNHIEKREDSVEFFLKYKNTSAYIQANWITPVKIRKLNITGKEGYLEMDYINQQIEFYKSNYNKFKEVSDNFSDYILRFSESDKINISVAKKEPLKEEISYFIECITKNQKIDSSFAVEALKIALNI